MVSLEDVVGKRQETSQKNASGTQKYESGVHVAAKANATMKRRYFGLGSPYSEVTAIGENISWGATKELGIISAEHGGRTLSETLYRSVTGAVLTFYEYLRGKNQLEIKKEESKQIREQCKTAENLAQKELEGIKIKAESDENVSRNNVKASENELKAIEVKRNAMRDYLEAARKTGNYPALTEGEE